MGADALRAAQAVGYTGVGTIEFLLDRQGNYYFIEMNTRIQVEHPVTEMVTGIDLVREQINIAAGLPLSFTQEEVKQQGHALECRICAVNPEKGFAPSCGKLTLIHQPGGAGVRFDSMLYNGCTVSPYYDSLLGKMIVHAPTREQAIARMQRALGELVIEGVEVNTDFQSDLVGSPWFLSGDYHTGTVEESLNDVI
jgi:acetyl-CoA carboxylase biotin carboxylase subunit